MIEQISLRKTFGECLEKLGGKYKNLAVLDADLSNWLNTINFAKSFPDRHFTVASGENTMLSMAAGLTIRGKLPFVCSTTASLVCQGMDALKNSVTYPNLNIKIIGSNSGISNCDEPAAKSCYNDLAILSSLPNLKIFTPCDAIELKAMLDFISSDFGPTFIRLPKHTLVNIHDNNYEFKPGEPEIIQKGDKISIFSYGHLLHECLKTTTELASRGLSAQVINIASFVPLNEEKIREICHLSELIVTVEDHFLLGGLGSRIANILNQSNDSKIRELKVIQIGLENHPESIARYEDSLNKNNLSHKAIYEKIRESWLQH